MCVRILALPCASFERLLSCFRVFLSFAGVFTFSLPSYYDDRPLLLYIASSVLHREGTRELAPAVCAWLSRYIPCLIFCTQFHLAGVSILKLACASATGVLVLWRRRGPLGEGWPWIAELEGLNWVGWRVSGFVASIYFISSNPSSIHNR